MSTLSAQRLPEQRPGSVFVGRAHELDELRAGLTHALAGRGGLFMLVGEPGIGKTRLADELTAQARTQGIQVLWGRCWEGQGAPAFWPWVQIVRSYMHDCEPADLRADMASVAPAIAQVIPDVLPHFPDLPVAPRLEPAQARFRFFDSVSTFLKAAAQRRPLVLIFDDLQAADEPSILLLQFLARDIRDARLLVVGTYRDADVIRDHPLSGSLGAVARESRCLSLQGLAMQDVARFIQRTTGITPAPNLVAAVCERSDGNPFFVSEIVRLLDSEGHLQQPGSAASWSVSIPHGVRETIRRRVKRLSRETNEALTVAAVVGREFSVDVLEQVSGLSSPELSQALDAAMEPRLIAEVPGAIGRYRFSHALVRETLCEELSATRRVQLHRRIGEVLDRLYASNPEPHVVELAHHFFEAAHGGGDVRKSIDYSRRAAKQATVQLAYEEAAEHYERALRGLELEPTGDERLRCELLVTLGETQMRRDEAQWRGYGASQARDTLKHAAELARRLAQADLLARAALALGGSVIGTGYGVFDPELVHLLDAALAALGAGDSPLRARVLSRLAMALYWSEARGRRADLSQQAIGMARRLGDPVTLAYALNNCRGALRGPDNPQWRLEAATEIVELADATGDREMAMKGRMCRIVDLLELGAVSRVDMEFDVFSMLARELRLPQYLWWATFFRAMRLQLEGRFEDAERLAHEAVSMGYGGSSPDAVQALSSLTYMLRKEQGRLEEIEPMLNGFVAQFPRIPAWRAVLADLYSTLGRAADARREFEQLAANDFEDLPCDQNWMPTFGGLAGTCAFLGDERRAARLYSLMLPHAQQVIVVGTAIACGGAASHYLGLLAATLQRWDQAAVHFDDAVAILTRLGARPLVAHTQYEYARAFLTRSQPGDRQKALALLNDACTTFAELGMTSYLDRAIALQTAAAAPDVPDHERSLHPRSFRSDGSYWDIAYDGTTVRLKQNKGLQYVAYLLRHPGREFHVADLLSVANGQPTSQRNHAYTQMSSAQLAAENLSVGEYDDRPAPDAQARAAYRHRLESLKDELEEAERFNDTLRAGKAREEIDFVTVELAGAYGLGDRPHRSDSVERIRKAVTNRIRDALARIQKAHPALWGHLTKSVKTGIFCSYIPDTPTQWDV